MHKQTFSHNAFLWCQFFRASFTYSSRLCSEVTEMETECFGAGNPSVTVATARGRGTELPLGPVSHPDSCGLWIWRYRRSMYTDQALTGEDMHQRSTPEYWSLLLWVHNVDSCSSFQRLEHDWEANVSLRSPELCAHSDVLYSSILILIHKE